MYSFIEGAVKNVLDLRIRLALFPVSQPELFRKRGPDVPENRNALLAGFTGNRIHPLTIYDDFNRRKIDRSVDRTMNASDIHRELIIDKYP